MTAPTQAEPERLQFLCELVELEDTYLAQTDTRLFAKPMTAAIAAALPTQADLSERVDAFVARLSRLQDGLADKLLPALLRAVAEAPGPTLDNLNKSERFGWLPSAADWVACRQLRNRLVHEYVKDPALLADGLNAVHGTIPMLLHATASFCTQARSRLQDVTAFKGTP